MVGIYAPQRTAPAKTVEAFTNEINKLITEAHQKRFDILITGDYNGNLNYKLDCNKEPQHPPGETTTPWIQNILQNPTNTKLVDPWRLTHPTEQTYTYTHQYGNYRDRKDFTLMTRTLHRITTATTSSLWHRNKDHEAISLSMDLSKCQENIHQTKPLAQPQPEYAPHTETEKWDKFKELIKTHIKTIDTQTPAPEQIDSLMDPLIPTAEQAGVITHKRAPPHIKFPFQSKNMKTWIKRIKLLNEVTHPDFQTYPHHKKRKKLQPLLPYLVQDPQAYQNNPQYYAWLRSNQDLSPLWRATLRIYRDNLRKKIYDTNQTLEKQRKAHFKKKTEDLARDYPSKFVRMFKDATEGPTSTAISTTGEVLTEIPELSQEAQNHLQQTLAPPTTESPLGTPWQLPHQLSAEQAQNRNTFEKILHMYATRLTPSQQTAIKNLAAPVTPEEIRTILRRQKRNAYNPGHPMPLLKELPDEALPIIANYITETIRNPHTATNTNDLIAHLILLPKQDPQDLKNTRPITMCTAMYKLTAQVFSTRIAHIIQTNNFLLPTNVGFTPHGETHHLIMPLQIMYDLNHTRINTPKYQHIHTLMVDLSQAYDRVPWWALQQTLRHLQFPTEMIEWLANATEFTQTHLKFPQGLDPSPLQFTPTRGIKQGCPLSPILFAIFNDTLLRWIQIHQPSTNPP
jgi:hypothetical protein